MKWEYDSSRRGKNESMLKKRNFGLAVTETQTEGCGLIENPHERDEMCQEKHEPERQVGRAKLGTLVDAMPRLQTQNQRKQTEQGRSSDGKENRDGFNEEYEYHRHESK
jgi:hypothetical protein